MLLGSETALLRMSHVLLGMIVRRYELRMKVQSHRSWDAGSRLGHDMGFKSIFPHLRSYCYGAERRLYPHCFSWMYPHHSHQPRCPFRDQSKPMFMYRTLFKSRPGYQLNPKKTKNQKPNIPLIQSLRCQWVPTNRRGFAQRLLCMGLQGCTFAIPLCCWKNTPWKQESLGMEWFSSVLWHFYFIFFVWFLSSWLSKAYFFEYSVRSCIFCGCNKIEK